MCAEPATPGGCAMHTGNLEDRIGNSGPDSAGQSLCARSLRQGTDVFRVTRTTGTGCGTETPEGHQSGYGSGRSQASDSPSLDAHR